MKDDNRRRHCCCPRDQASAAHSHTVAVWRRSGGDSSLTRHDARTPLIDRSLVGDGATIQQRRASADRDVARAQTLTSCYRHMAHFPTLMLLFGCDHVTSRRRHDCDHAIHHVTRWLLYDRATRLVNADHVIADCYRGCIRMTTTTVAAAVDARRSIREFRAQTGQQCPLAVRVLHEVIWQHIPSKMRVYRCM